MFKLPEFPSNMPHDKTESRKATAHNHLWKIPAGVRGPETVHAFSCLPCLDSLSEREIENVNHRLASLEKILQASVRAQSGPQASPQTNSGAVPSPRDSQPAEREPDFAGSSSFVAQSKDVTQAFERSLGLANNTPSSAGDVSAAVATLRSFLYDKSASSDGTGAIPVHKPLQEAVHYPELANLELPSMQAVLKFFYEYPAMDASRLSDLCQKIYFPTEDYTIATFVTVHVSLFLLFRQMQKDTAKELQLGPIEIEACVATCSKNAETAMRSMRVYVEANYESIEALLLAAMMALELSRPSLAWALITTATRMVQDAGYHRLPAYSVAPEATKKRLLFWFIYAIDRCMALNLGRSPSLQDYDITTEWPKIPEELDGPFGRMYLGWISLGELQGQIYEQLYCARAQRQPPELRAQLARSLASKLLEMKDYFEIDFEGQPFAEACSENLSSSRICLASILTLIYRMIPADPLPSGLPPHPLKFNDLAVQSAREAVTMHNNAWDTLKYRERNEWHLFVHWTMLWSPFIPYIVVFGNTIADRNAADLELLKAVVSGLESVADMSPGVGKLYRACRIFYQIASMVLAQDGVGNESVLQGHACPPPATSTHALPQHLVPAWFQASFSSPDAGMPELPLFQQDWDAMLDGWDLGTDGGDFRDNSAIFGQHLSEAAETGAHKPVP
ncbi:hypothetical protein H2202_002482 [Exophiala xenobiotica]|nr:hypothetical protein H2202_002482 [Exophiala xenobiotica]